MRETKEYQEAVELLFRFFMEAKFFDEEFLEPHDVIDELLAYAKGGWPKLVEVTVQNLDYSLLFSLNEGKSLLEAAEVAFKHATAEKKEEIIQAAVLVATEHQLHKTLEEFL